MRDSVRRHRSIRNPRRSRRAARGRAIFGSRAIFGVLLAALCACAAPALAAAAEPADVPANTSAPLLTGAAAAGQTLSCSPGDWTGNPASYAYQWLRDGAPIAGQTAASYSVQRADEGHSISCSVTASSVDGQYSLAGLPTGSYGVEFSPGEGVGNYQRGLYDERSTFENFDPLLLTQSELTSGIDAKLVQGGQIAGKLTGAEGGAPVANGTVCVEEPSTSYFQCAESDAAGEYLVSGLPAGSYEVSVFFSASEHGSYTASKHEGSVQVAVGETPVKVDFPSLVLGGQITGTVTDAETKAPIAHIQVCGVPTSSGSGPCVYTDAAGSYRMAGLSENGYDVEFSNQRRDGEAPVNYVSYTAPEQHVALSSSYTVNAELHVGGQITGRLTSSTGAPVPNVLACASRKCATTDASGEYTISGLSTGTYDVLFERGREKTKLEGIAVTAGAPATEAPEAHLRLGGRITGVVTSAASNAPLGSIEVCANAYDTYCALTDANGEYTISGVEEDEYLLSFQPQEGSAYAFQYYGGGTSERETHLVDAKAERTVTNIDAALATGAQITGRVTSAASGAGIVGAEACAFFTGEAPISACTLTTAGATSAAATSNAIAIPAPPTPAPSADSSFEIVSRRFNRRNRDLEVTLRTVDEGTLSWSLLFANSDVGFADSLSSSHLAPLVATAGRNRGAGASAGSSRHRHGHRKKCRTGFVKHAGRCVHRKVRFASGSESLPATTVVVRIRPDAKARRALKQGHALHVSGSLTFQSALGGSAVTHMISFAARPPKSAHHRRHKKKKKKKKGARG